MKYALTTLVALLFAGCAFTVEMEWPKLAPEEATAEPRFVTGLPELVGLVGIRFFQRCISPYDGPRCVFYPSCSEYGAGCLRRHGPLLGYLRTCDRLLRCHGGASGYPLRGRLLFDPVP